MHTTVTRAANRTSLAARNALIEHEPRPADLSGLGVHLQLVLEAPGREVVRLDAAHDEHLALLLEHAPLIRSHASHPVAARALDEFDEVGVIHDGAHIRILVVDADCEFVAHLTNLLLFRPPAERRRPAQGHAATGGRLMRTASASWPVARPNLVPRS